MLYFPHALRKIRLPDFGTGAAPATGRRGMDDGPALPRSTANVRHPLIGRLQFDILSNYPFERPGRLLLAYRKNQDCLECCNAHAASEMGLPATCRRVSAKFALTPIAAVTLAMANEQRRLGGRATTSEVRVTLLRHPFGARKMRQVLDAAFRFANKTCMRPGISPVPVIPG